MRSKTIALIYGVLAAVLLGGARDVDGQQRFSFIGVGEDTLWQRADSTLRRLITDAPRGFEFVGDSALLKLPYDVAIETLVGWPDTEPVNDNGTLFGIN